jgi:ATP-dependent exoDNAse (exonuclease V) beta subunit
LTDTDDAAALMRLVATIQRAQNRIGIMPLSELLGRAFSERDADLHYLVQGIAGKRSFANFRKLQRLADRYQSEGGDPLSFAAYLDTQAELGQGITNESVSLKDQPCVRIITIHGSKGLEFPVVAVPLVSHVQNPAKSKAHFIPGFTANASPVLSFRAKTTEGEVVSQSFETLRETAVARDKDEMKRLLYVACTRASELLLVSYQGANDKGLSGLFAQGLMEAECVPERLPILARTETVKRESALLPPTITEVPPTCHPERSGVSRVVEGPQSSEHLGATGEPCTERRTHPDLRGTSTNQPGELCALRTARPQAAAPPRYEREPHTRPVFRGSPTPVNQISYSDLGVFNTCPRQYYFRNILRMGTLESASPTSATNRGSVIHLLLEHARDRRIDPARRDAIFGQNQVDPSQRAELEAAATTFLRSNLAAELEACPRIERERQFYLALEDQTTTETGEPCEIRRTHPDSTEASTNQSGEFCALCRARPGTPDNPAGDGRTPPHPSSPRYLKGYIDACGWRADGSALIVDYKSGTADVSAPQKQEAYAAQAACYALVALTQGAPRVDVAFVRPEVAPAPDGQPQTFTFPFTAADAPALRADLLAKMRAMEQARDLPSDPPPPSDTCLQFCQVPPQLCAIKAAIIEEGRRAHRSAQPGEEGI